MSNASNRNFGLAQTERERRLAMALDDPGDATSAQAVNSDPGWQAFFGSLQQKAQDANAAGLNFRADLSGLGRPGVDGMEVMPGAVQSARGQAANVALGQLADQNRARLLAEQAQQDQTQQDALTGLRKGYAEQVDASQNAPLIDQPNISLGNRPDGHAPVITMRPSSSDPTAQALARMDPITRMKAQQALDAQKVSLERERASTAASNADVTAKTGAGTLPDYLARTAAAAGKKLSDLTPEEVNKAREDYLNTTAMAGIQGPKVQNALEQQYRTVLEKELNSRSGGLGTEDQKVNSAVHAMSLMKQFQDPKTGEYNIPKSQYKELAGALATIISPNGKPSDSMREGIEQRTAKGDLNDLMTYVTGTPFNGSTQDVFKLLHDSIDRQGRVAQANRQRYLDNMRALAPTSLDQNRRDQLEKSLILNSLDDPQAGGGGAAPGAPAAGGAAPLKIGRYSVEIHPPGGGH